MTRDDEAELIGRESSEVPRIDPDEYCNGKTSEKDDDGINLFTGYCDLRAGQGTDHLGEGRCKYHGGCSTGAPKGNQNRTTHGLNADPHNYYQSLSHEQKEYIHDVAASIEDRIRTRTGTVDYLDRTLARRIAIELHIVSKASDYVENESGLTQTITTKHGSHEKTAALLGEIRKRDNAIFKMLKDIGVLDDPESQKADALEQWQGFIDGGSP